MLTLSVNICQSRHFLYNLKGIKLLSVYAYWRDHMRNRTLEECKEQLRKSDENTLERRAKRLQELDTIQTDGRLFSSQKEWDYAGEASDSYINGNYRSAIFCCACAVDQILKYEYLKLPGNSYQDIARCTFGQTVSKCKNKSVTSLFPYLDKAKILNEMRNGVSAHPLFIDLPVDSDPERKTRDILLIEDIKRLLKIVENINPSLKSEIETTRLISESEGKTFIFGQIINQECEIPYNLNGFWGLMEIDVLKYLANQAWHILKVIAEGLYGLPL